MILGVATVHGSSYSTFVNLDSPIISVCVLPSVCKRKDVRMFVLKGRRYPLFLFDTVMNISDLRYPDINTLL